MHSNRWSISKKPVERSEDAAGTVARLVDDLLRMVTVVSKWAAPVERLAKLRNIQKPAGLGTRKRFGAKNSKHLAAVAVAAVVAIVVADADAAVAAVVVRVLAFAAEAIGAVGAVDGVYEVAAVAGPKTFEPFAFHEQAVEGAVGVVDIDVVDPAGQECEMIIQLTWIVVHEPDVVQAGPSDLATAAVVAVAVAIAIVTVTVTVAVAVAAAVAVAKVAVVVFVIVALASSVDAWPPLLPLPDPRSISVAPALPCTTREDQLHPISWHD